MTSKLPCGHSTKPSGPQTRQAPSTEKHISKQE
jgi:hypothetical protein